jgi:hypothetical protein
VKRHAALQAGDFLAQQFVLHAKFAQALVGGPQPCLNWVIFGTVFEPGVESGKGSLAPLLQSVGFDGNLARDGLD